MIRHFSTVSGLSPVRIEGQERYAYALSDHTDPYDLAGWKERGGYQGAVILFYDSVTGDVYQPFAKKRDTVYTRPLFSGGRFWFLQADGDERTVTLYSWLPGSEPAAVTVLRMDETDLYNLSVMGEPVYVISQGSRFSCYWPERFSFDLDPAETVICILDDSVLCEAWVEEGWDAVHDRASDSYRFYNRVIIRDRKGNILSEETGSLYRAPDGAWWIG